MTVYKNNSLQINLCSDKGQISVECLASVDSEEFKNGLVRALELAKQNHVRQWLIDARRIGELPEADESWINTDFFPQLMDKNSTCFIAMVISDACYIRMIQKNGWFGLKSYNSFIKINTFYNMQDAENWLVSYAEDKKSK